MQSSARHFFAFSIVLVLMVAGLFVASEQHQHPIFAIPATEALATTEILRHVDDAPKVIALAEVAPLLDTPSPAYREGLGFHANVQDLIADYQRNRYQVAGHKSEFIANVSPQLLISYISDQESLTGIMSEDEAQLVMSRRNAAIEILGAIAAADDHPEHQVAVDGLIAIAATSIVAHPSQPEQPIAGSEMQEVAKDLSQKPLDFLRMIIFENKFEALAVLAASDLPLALSVFSQIEPSDIRPKMRDALTKGLVLSGLSTDEASRRLSSVRQ